MIYFTNHVEAAPQAKVKKRKTLKQALQEKEEKAKEQALKRLDEAKSMKEVIKWYIVATAYPTALSESQVYNIVAGVPVFLKTCHAYLKSSEVFWGHLIDF